MLVRITRAKTVIPRGQDYSPRAFRPRRFSGIGRLTWERVRAMRTWCVPDRPKQKQAEPNGIAAAISNQPYRATGGLKDA